MRVTLMANTDITISFAQLVWVVGGITAVVAFLKWALTPIKQIENHEQRIKDLESAEKERKATDRYTTKALNAIVNHMIDGNGIEKLREVRDEYQNEIINHHV